MWVRTPSSDLCNLSHARRITLEMNVISKQHEVQAWFAGEGEPTVIAEYERREDAEQYREGLAGEIGARKFKLSYRNREESKS